MRRALLPLRLNRAALYGTLILFAATSPSYAQWTETVLHSFKSGSDGANPSSPLVPDPQGNFYGAAGGGTSSHGTIFELSPKSGGGWTETVIYNFSGPDGSGANGLVRDSAGNLYGTTGGGGANGRGVVFELSLGSSGWTETVLYNFTGREDGGLPEAGVILDASGNLYGTTGYGGTPKQECTAGCGVVFELSPGADGWIETVLYSFRGYPNDGSEPRGTLIFGRAGNLYSTTYGGGTDESGTVFELSPSSGGGWTESVIHNFVVFSESGYDGEWPTAGLAMDGAGDLYGTTLSGGDHFDGTVFKLTPSSSGWQEKLIYTFKGGSDGADPYCTPVYSDGALYGTVALASAYPSGIVFKIGRNAEGEWVESSLHTLMPSEGGFPESGVTIDSAGNIYTTAVEGGPNGYGSAFELNAGSGYSFTLLHSFTGDPGGDVPLGGVAFDASGNLYGTTWLGGAHDAGTVFQVSPVTGGWNHTALFSFDGADNGDRPYASVIVDSAGNLYGTTSYGGAAKCRCGEVYEMSQNSSGGWVQTVLHSFSGGPSDGDHPFDGLAFDSAGSLYGATYQGGSFGQGAVFELTHNSGGGWLSNVIYSFTGGADGGLPYENNVVVDSAGNVYGTTPKGGAYSNGTIYEVSPSSGGGWTETVLYSFAGGADGGNPGYGLTLDAVGNLYGATYSGGVNGLGTVFQLMPVSGGWQKNVLLSFNGGSEGANPYGNLTFDAAGNLYGMAGIGSYGEDLSVVYELSPSAVGWTENVLYTFTKDVNGGSPVGSLVFDSLGNIYGATTYGGAASLGLVFELSP